MTIGILTEKPSAARNFAKALGGPSGTYNGESYVIVPARGHLYELAQPENQVAGADAAAKDALSSWSLEHLPWNSGSFGWVMVPIKGASGAIADVKKVLGAAGITEIVIATDLDPTGEGDAIAWNIIDQLRLRPGKFSRMEFTDEAAPSLQKAFVNRRSITSRASEGVLRKAEFRNRLDFLTIQFTRVASRVAGQRGTVLRQGRLKSAIVTLVGDQLKAYNEYKRVPFFQNRFKDENNVIYTDPEQPRFLSAGAVPPDFSPSSVTVDKVAQKTTAPPKLPDLAQVAALLAPKGYGAADVLKMAQSMYEKQVLSYPRTDDKVITPEQFAEMVPLIDKIAAVVGVDTSLLTHRTARSTHVRVGAAHGANRPGLNVPGSMAEVSSAYGKLGVELYTLLAKGFLAMVAEDYGYESQSGHVTDYPTFLGTASVPKFAGWKAVFSEVVEADEDEVAGGLGKQAVPFVFEGAPVRPAHPTMKWLMAQLEKRDVGTGATRTSTFAEMTRTATSQQLTDTKGKITLTEVGQMSYLILPDTRIGDLGLTEKVYGQMREIAAGTLEADRALAEVAEWVKHDIDKMKHNAISMKKELNMTDTTTEEVEKFSGPWTGPADVAQGTVSFKRVWGKASPHRFTDAECTALLRGETISFESVSAAGNDYTAKGSLAHQTFTNAAGKAFPFFGFKLAPRESPADGVQDVVAKKRLTEDEKARIRAGETVVVDGLMSKAGRPFKAGLKLVTKNGKPSIEFDFDAAR